MDEGPTVRIKDWVLVRMPPEADKPADRYAVVEVTANAVVSRGRVVESELNLAYARKRRSIEVTRDAEARQRTAEVVG